MRVDLYCIWFSPDGSIHKHTLEQLKEWVNSEPRPTNICLVTDTQRLQEEVTGITIKDYRNYKSNMLYDCLNKFVQIGHNGDKAAYAVASDILRMILLHEQPLEQMLIFLDANDVDFTIQKNTFINLKNKLETNHWGYLGHKNFSTVINDFFIICKRESNIAFFNEFFTKFAEYVIKVTPEYHISHKKSDWEVFRMANIEKFFEIKKKIVLRRNRSICPFFCPCYSQNTQVEKICVILKNTKHVIDGEEFFGCTFIRPNRKEGNCLTWQQSVSDVSAHIEHKKPFIDEDTWNESEYTYKEGNVENLGVNRFAQNKEGKRYHYEDNGFCKYIKGYKHSMNSDEIKEFKMAIKKTYNVDIPSPTSGWCHIL